MPRSSWGVAKLRQQSWPSRGVVVVAVAGMAWVAAAGAAGAMVAEGTAWEHVLGTHGLV